MRVLIGGASGFIGSALVPRLVAAGHQVVELRRPESGAGGGRERGGRRGRGAAGSLSRGGAPGMVPWDPDRGILEPRALHGMDAVIHLGGVSISSGRWSTAKKQAILDSRVRSTLLLAERIAVAPEAVRPRAFIVSSATGYYGNRGDETLTESSPPGEGFLADVCRAWEEAAAPAVRAGVRVAHVRTGIVVGKGGGAVSAMKLPFRLGVGGPIGNGRQYWPWISLSDVARVYERLLDDGAMAGPVNTVAPHAPTAGEFARAFGRAVHRPAVLPAPAFALRLLLGEMADAMLLASTRAVPERLTAAGFNFRHPDLDAALSAALA